VHTAQDNLQMLLILVLGGKACYEQLPIIIFKWLDLNVGLYNDAEKFNAVQTREKNYVYNQMQKQQNI